MTTTVPANCPPTCGELSQVWTNLVDNAVDAMEGMDGRGVA